MKIKGFFVRGHHKPFFIVIYKIMGVNIHNIWIHFLYKVILHLPDSFVIRPLFFFSQRPHMGVCHIPVRASGFYENDMAGIKILAN